MQTVLQRGEWPIKQRNMTATRHVFVLRNSFIYFATKDWTGVSATTAPLLVTAAAQK